MPDDNFDRPWRKQIADRTAAVASETISAFTSTFLCHFPGATIEGVSDRLLGAIAAIVRDSVGLEVESRWLEDVGSLVRIRDVGDADRELYAVELASCNGGGIQDGEWWLVDSGPGGPSSDSFPTVADARAFVALLDAGFDPHKALAFVVSAESKEN